MHRCCFVRSHRYGNQTCCSSLLYELQSYGHQCRLVTAWTKTIPYSPPCCDARCFWKSTRNGCMPYQVVPWPIHLGVWMMYIINRSSLFFATFMWSLPSTLSIIIGDVQSGHGVSSSNSYIHVPRLPAPFAGLVICVAMNMQRYLLSLHDSNVRFPRYWIWQTSLLMMQRAFVCSGHCQQKQQHGKKIYHSRILRRYF